MGKISSEALFSVSAVGSGSRLRDFEPHESAVGASDRHTVAKGEGAKPGIDGVADFDEAGGGPTRGGEVRAGFDGVGDIGGDGIGTDMGQSEVVVAAVGRGAVAEAF